MKALLFILVLIAPAHAQASKIVFSLKGEQQTVEIGQGGGVTSDAQVLWDERKDGPLPANAPAGYAERYEEEVSETVSVREPMLDEKGEPVLDENGKPVLHVVEKIIKKMVPHLRENLELKAEKARRDQNVADEKTAADAKRAAYLALKAKVEAKTATAAEVRDVMNYVLKRLEKLGE